VAHSVADRGGRSDAHRAAGRAAKQGLVGIDAGLHLDAVACAAADRTIARAGWASARSAEHRAAGACSFLADHRPHTGRSRPSRSRRRRRRSCSRTRQRAGSLRPKTSLRLADVRVAVVVGMQSESISRSSGTCTRGKPEATAALRLIRQAPGHRSWPHESRRRPCSSQTDSSPSMASRCTSLAGSVAGAATRALPAPAACRPAALRSAADRRRKCLRCLRWRRLHTGRAGLVAADSVRRSDSSAL